MANDLLMDMDKAHVSLLLLLELSAVSDNVRDGTMGFYYNSFKQNKVSVVLLFPGSNRTWKGDLKESA